MTNPTEPRRVVNPEQAILFLSDRLRSTLALSHRGGDDLAPLILGTLPRGSRLLLDLLGALRQDPRDPAELVLTPSGRELAASCAVAGLSPDTQKGLAELKQEQARRAAAGEDRVHLDGACPNRSEGRRP